MNSAVSPHGSRRLRLLRWGCACAVACRLLFSPGMNSVAWGASAPGPSSAPASLPEQEDPAVATIGSVRIGAAALERELSASRAATDGQKRAALEKLIRFEMLHAAARQAGYADRPEVAAAIGRLIVAAYLREQLEPRLAALAVTEQELEAYFAGHQADFTTPQAVRAAVIQIKVSPRASAEKREELRARAEAARAEALALPAAAASFGSVAVKYSDDQATRYRGGDAGWLTTGRPDTRWDREVEAAIFSLSTPGAVAPVVEAASGFHLVKLMETRQSASRTLDQVRDRLSHLILSEKKARVEQEFYAALAAQIPVAIDEHSLAAVPLPGPRGAAAPPPPPLPEPFGNKPLDQPLIRQ